MGIEKISKNDPVNDFIFEGTLYGKYQVYREYPNGAGSLFLKMIKQRYPQDVYMSEDWLIKMISEKENIKIDFCGYLNI